MATLDARATRRLSWNTPKRAIRREGWKFYELEGMRAGQYDTGRTGREKGVGGRRGRFERRPWEGQNTLAYIIIQYNELFELMDVSTPLTLND